MWLAKESYWIQVGGKLLDCTKPLIDAVKFSPRNPHGIKEVKEEYWIYQTPKSEREWAHIGRYGEHKESFPDEFRRTMERGYFDLVFLIEAEARKQYVVKAFQSADIDSIREEWAVSEKMSDINVGPRLVKDKFRVNLGPRHIYLMAEECFSVGEGWVPLARVWKNVKKHQAKFADEFAMLVRALHRNNMYYNDNFFLHLFIKTAPYELKLIDYGAAFETTSEERFDAEVEECLKFLKENLFSPENQKLFLSTYQEGFRHIKKHMRTDTVAKGGIDRVWR